MSENASWCKRCLRTILMMFCGLVLIRTCAAKGTQNYESTFSTSIVSSHQRRSSSLNNYTRYSITRNEKTKPMKYWECRPKNVEPIIIKLTTVIARYDVKKRELKALFSGVANSDLKKFEKFGDLLPKHRQLKDFNCTKFKYPKTLKKWIYKLLLKFHSGVLRFSEIFEKLINYEQSPPFKKKYWSNEEILKILYILQIDLRMLDLEISEIVERKNVRLNFSCQPENWTLENLPPPKSPTDLMISQWEAIQSSKMFLKGWKKKLRKICKCWKRAWAARKGSKRKQKENVGIMRHTACQEEIKMS